MLIRFQHGAPHFLVLLESGNVIHLVRTQRLKPRLIPGQFFRGKSQIMTPNILRIQKYLAIDRHGIHNFQTVS